MGVTLAFLASDLHGGPERWSKLLEAVRARRPRAIFLAGDLLPFPASRYGADEGFAAGWLLPRFLELKRRMGPEAPEVFLIPGNDDPRAEETHLFEGERLGAWRYLQGRRTEWEGHPVFGYAYVPPTPFRMKDWERYDISRFADPGCISPEEGWRSVPVAEREARLATIAADLTHLAGEAPLENAIFLFHSPPYRTALDRAALDGMMVNYAPLDVHVGSVAIRRFIEERQPLLTLHGHIHESARLTGSFRDRIGRTICLSAAHDGPELALVTFTPKAPGEATRELI
jgi:uncharacterized protein